MTSSQAEEPSSPGILRPKRTFLTVRRINETRPEYMDPLIDVAGDGSRAIVDCFGSYLLDKRSYLLTVVALKEGA